MPALSALRSLWWIRLLELEFMQPPFAVAWCLLRVRHTRPPLVLSYPDLLRVPTLRRLSALTPPPEFLISQHRRQQGYLESLRIQYASGGDDLNSIRV